MVSKEKIKLRPGFEEAIARQVALEEIHEVLRNMKIPKAGGLKRLRIIKNPS